MSQNKKSENTISTSSPVPSKYPPKTNQFTISQSKSIQIIAVSPKSKYSYNYSPTRAPSVMSSTFPSNMPSTIPLLKPSTSPTTDRSQAPSNKHSSLPSAVTSVDSYEDLSIVPSYVPVDIPYRSPSVVISSLPYHNYSVLTSSVPSSS